MVTNSISRGFSLIMAFLLLPMVLMGCSRQVDREEQSFIYVADDEVSEENTENIAEIPYSETPVEFTGEIITQIIESSNGRKISIDAQVHDDGINQVSCYRYVPEPFTETHRKDLLKEMHHAETWDVTEAAVYNPENDAWEFTTPVGESWIYQVFHSEIPEEEILNHEDTSANISSNIKQVSPVVVPKDQEDALLTEVIGEVPADIEAFGLYDIGAIDKNDNYLCSFIHICEEDNGQFYAKAVFKKMIDGMPVTVWHNFSTATKKDSPFAVKVWGSLFSEEEIGLDKPILSVDEAIAAMQEQIDSISIQAEQLSITKISLEYLSVISSEGDLLIVPIWRFWTGEDETERCLRSEEVFAVNAVSGELIWENRKTFIE